MPAKLYDLLNERVTTTSLAPCFTNSRALSSAKSAYASSTTNGPSILVRNWSISASETVVPDGELGLARNVRSAKLADQGDGSLQSAVNGTVMNRAPCKFARVR